MEKTFLEFFAGIGLVHDALRYSGWNCVYANDIDPKKHQMYKEHFDECEYYHQEDIWKSQEILSHIKKPAFMATASFPCTDMSLAGHYKGFKGRESSTFFGFMDIIKSQGRRKPKLLMIENVTGFLTAHNGNDFQTAVKSISELGYYVDSFIVNAKYFVPQSRQRLFVIGYHQSVKSSRIIKRSKIAKFGDSWHRAMSLCGMLRSKKLIALMEDIDLPTGWVTTDLKEPVQDNYDLRDFIDLDDGQEWWTEENTKKHVDMMSDLHKEKINTLKNQNELWASTIFRRQRHGQMRSEVRFDGVAGCLRTPKGGSARQIVIVLNNGKIKMKWMTPREYARLQGANDYIIEVPINQALFGFGDAVCVPVIRWIDKNILSPYYDDYCRKRKINSQQETVAS